MIVPTVGAVVVAGGMGLSRWVVDGGKRKRKRWLVEREREDGRWLLEAGEKKFGRGMPFALRAHQPQD